MTDEFQVLTPWLQIGRGTYYGSDVVLKTWLPEERIIIGKYCSIGEHVVICTGGMRRTDIAALFPFDVSRTYQSTANTVIGNDVWVGFGAMVLGGAVVGDGTVIASGAVVFDAVPPFAVVAGNPARVLRYRFSRPVVESLLRIAWWHWPETQVRANVDWFYRPIAEFVAHFDPQEGHSQRWTR